MNDTRIGFVRAAGRRWVFWFSRNINIKQKDLGFIMVEWNRRAVEGKRQIRARMNKLSLVYFSCKKRDEMSNKTFSSKQGQERKAHTYSSSELCAEGLENSFRRNLRRSSRCQHINFLSSVHFFCYSFKSTIFHVSIIIGYQKNKYERERTKMKSLRLAKMKLSSWSSRVNTKYPYFSSTRLLCSTLSSEFVVCVFGINSSWCCCTIA